MESVVSQMSLDNIQKELDVMSELYKNGKITAHQARRMSVLKDALSEIRRAWRQT